SHTHRMAERIRRFDICEIRDGLAGIVELPFRKTTTYAWFKRENCLPGWLILKSCQQLGCLLAETLYDSGIIECSAAFPRYLDRRLDTFQALEDNRILRQRHDAHRTCDTLPFDLAGSSLTIPALE